MKDNISRIVEDLPEDASLNDLLVYESICKLKKELDEKCVYCRKATKEAGDKLSMNKEELAAAGKNPPKELNERLDAELKEKRDEAIRARRDYIKLLVSGKYGSGPEFNNVIFEYTLKCNNRSCCFSTMIQAYADSFDINEMDSWE
jgi:hypothetical protein